MKIDHIQDRLEVSDARLQGSSFERVNLSDSRIHDVNLGNVDVDNVNLAGSRWNNVNLSGLRVTDANLSHASIRKSCTHGMTIDGIAIEDLMAAYQAAQQKA